MWKCTITVTKAVEEVVAEYDEKSRGRELLAFNDWRVFDKTVQTLVKGQQHPALATLYIIKGDYLFSPKIFSSSYASQPNSVHCFFFSILF